MITLPTIEEKYWMEQEEMWTSEKQEPGYGIGWIFDQERRVKERSMTANKINDGKLADANIKRCLKCGRGWELVSWQGNKDMEKRIIHYPRIIARNKEEKVCMACVIRGE